MTGKPRILYIPHGGGPLPLLGDSDHTELVSYLSGASSLLGRPSAVIVVSAHWEEAVPTVTGAAQPPLVYDYYGFPEEAYRLRYPAPGAPALAEHLAALLDSAGLDPRIDSDRGLDHGVFVPLALMYPEADIPCVQLSLVRGLDPELHLRMGAALRSLAEKDVLLLGSGFSFHNMRAFFLPGASGVDEHNDAFQKRLEELCSDPSLSEQARWAGLSGWEELPNARYCHPREEHLLPLHVCAAAGAGPARAVRSLQVLGKRALALGW